MAIAVKDKVNVGADANPFREVVRDDDLLDTDAAAAFLRTNGYHISATTLISRRTFGKAPAFLKIGVAVRYREKDLRAFLETAGLQGLPERQPERRTRNAK
jgi:hypothetical protein